MSDEILSNPGANTPSLVKENHNTIYPVWVILFGLCLGFILIRAFDDVGVSLYGLFKNVDPEIAREAYSEKLYPYLDGLLGVFFASVATGLLLKKNKLWLSGIVAIPWLFLWGRSFFSALKSGTPITFMIPGTLIFFSVLPIAVAGGFLARVINSESLPVDIENKKITFFGIWWIHYVWLGIPLALHGILEALIYTATAFVLNLCALAYHSIHPSLWFNASWNTLFLFFGPIILGIAVLGSFVASIRLWRLLQLHQKHIVGLGLVWRVALYAFVTPTVSYFFAASYAEYVFRLPKP